MTTPQTTSSPPRALRPRRKRSRVVAEMAILVVLIVLVMVAATTLLGKNSSTKFSSVANAICAERGSGQRARILDDRAGVIGATPLVATLSGLDPQTASGGGCGGGGGYTPNVASGPVASPSSPSKPSRPAANAASPPAGGAATPPSGQPAAYSVNAIDPAALGAASAGHSFVSTATMTVRVNLKTDPNAPAPDAETAKRQANLAVAEQKNKAVMAVVAVGGGLFGEQTSFEGSAKSTVTLKVPAVAFTNVLNQLMELGDLQSNEVKTDEVTQQVIDLDARIVASTNGLERTRGLLGKANNLGDVNTLEADVGRRETELETLRGQQAALAQQVSLSTVIFTLTSSPPPPVATPPTTTPPPVAAQPAPLPGFLDGLNNGWKVFTTVGTVVLAAFGAALPFLPFVIAGMVIWRVLRRRSLRLAGTGPAPA